MAESDSDGPAALCEGARLLSAFLRAHNLHDKAAADAADVTPSAIVGWLSGDSRPRERRRLMLERWTAGAVPAAAWESDEERAALAGVVPYAPAADLDPDDGPTDAPSGEAA